MAVLLVIIIITAAVYMVLREELQREENKKWMYVVMGGLVVEGISLLFTLAYFLHNYMVHKRLSLLHLLDVLDRNSHSSD